MTAIKKTHCNNFDWLIVKLAIFSRKTTVHDNRGRFAFILSFTIHFFIFEHTNRHAACMPPPPLAIWRELIKHVLNQYLYVFFLGITFREISKLKAHICPQNKSDPRKFSGNEQRTTGSVLHVTSHPMSGDWGRLRPSWSAILVIFTPSEIQHAARKCWILHPKWEQITENI